MVRVGIVGTGNLVSIAGLHLNAYLLNPAAEVTALYDIDYDRAKNWANEKGLKNTIVCRTYDELLELVDAVSICTPNFTHVELTKKALDAGLHILCEKPIANNYLDGLKVIDNIENNNLINMVGFCYRYTPGAKYMKSLIDDGKIGNIYFYRETMSRGRLADADIGIEWRMQRRLSGSGSINDFGSHMIDLSEHLLEKYNSKIEMVNAYSNTFITERFKSPGTEKTKVENDDCAVFNAKTEGGTLLSFTASRLGGIQHTIEIIGSGGMLFYNEDKPLEIKCVFKQIDGGYEGQLASKKIPEEFIGGKWYGEEKNRFINEINSFIDAINNPKKEVPDFKRGLYVQNIVDIIEKASKTGESIKI